MRARREQHSASRISLDYSRCETPIAAYDERARKNGYERKMRRIGLLRDDGAEPFSLWLAWLTSGVNKVNCARGAGETGLWTGVQIWEQYWYY